MGLISKSWNMIYTQLRVNMSTVFADILGIKRT